MLAAKKMMITVMPVVLIALVGAATAHRDIVAGDRFIVNTDPLIVAGDREGVREDPHLVAGDREGVREDLHLVAGDREGVREDLHLVAGGRTRLDSHWGVVADRDYRAAAYRNA
jgi:hypothetical protein